MFKKLSIISLLVCFMLTFSGCNNEEKYELTVWKSLALIGVTYNQTMESLGELHTQGKVSDEVATKAVSLGKKFTPLYLAAIESLDIFVKNPDDTKLDTIKNSISAVNSSLNLLIDFAKQFGVVQQDNSSVLEGKQPEQVVKDIANQIKE